MRKPPRKVRPRSIEWFERDALSIDEADLDEISGSFVQHVIFPSLQRPSLAVKVWDIVENRACPAIVHGFSNRGQRLSAFIRTLLRPR